VGIENKKQGSNWLAGIIVTELEVVEPEVELRTVNDRLPCRYAKESMLTVAAR
jgi:hypothetical protein